MSLTETKLPSPLTRIVVISTLIGMLIGIGVAYLNHQSFGVGIFIMVGMGVVFAVSIKFFIAKWMYFWMETKLEIAAKEKEAAMKIESAKREERRKKAEAETAKIKAEQALANAATAKSADPSKPKSG